MAEGPRLQPSADVLVSVPVRNEAPRILETVGTLQSALRASGYSFRLALAEDGSTDRTPILIRQYAETNPDVIIQTHEERLGRGKALRELWTKEPAQIYAFTDADLACGVDPLVQAIRVAMGGDPIVVGSRYVPGAIVNRPPLRASVSKVYNWAVRGIFSDSVHDHQCGLKVFRAEVLHALLPLTMEDSWFWDTEILVIASRFGLKVTEVPVRWTETKSRRTEFGRLFSDIALHGSGLLRLKARLAALEGGSVRGPLLGPSGVEHPTAISKSEYQG